jgi:hypothetical protein
MQNNENKDWPKQSRTYTKETHLGRIYVIITYNNNDHAPDNLFAAETQGGPCFNSEVEALGRSLRLMYKYGVPTNEIIKQWQGIQCEPHWENGNLVKSVADALGQCLQEAVNDGYPI